MYCEFAVNAPAPVVSVEVVVAPTLRMKSTPGPATRIVYPTMALQGSGSGTTDQEMRMAAPCGFVSSGTAVTTDGAAGR